MIWRLPHPLPPPLPSVSSTGGNTQEDWEKKTACCWVTVEGIEWFTDRGLGVLAVVWFGSSPSTPSLPVSKLDWQHTGRLRKRDSLLTGEGDGGGEGAKSYDGEKARSSIMNMHPILSGLLRVSPLHSLIFDFNNVTFTTKLDGEWH